MYLGASGMALMVPSFRHPSVYYILETTFCCVLLEAILFVKQGKNIWISGHAVWHLLDAVALYFLFEYYRQFPQLRFEGRAKP